MLPEITTTEERVTVVNLCVEYMILRFGTHPKLHQKIEEAKEVIVIYPELKYEGSKHGFVRFQMRWY